MSRIESGRMTIQQKEFSFRDLLEQVNTMIREQCLAKELSYDFRILGYLDESYIGDAEKLKVVLLNILGNSVKFTPAGGKVSLSVELLKRFEDNVTLRFSMQDTGIGMDQAFIPKLFDAFSKEDEGVINKYGSTGLGMAITKNVVEMMNGQIDVESKKGVGTTFMVTVTLKVSQQEEKSQEDKKAAFSADQRVLVILNAGEGDEQAGHIFQEVGVSAEICSSGAEAYALLDLARARLQLYDLILVDRDLPEGGIEVAKAIREKYDSSFAVVLLAAAWWNDIMAEAMEAGVDGFVFKPLFATDILQEYGRVLEDRGAVAKKKKADLTGKRILMVEDTPVNAELMREFLEMRGVEVDHAENGQIAVDMFKQSEVGNYSAVLMDIRMPVMDGCEATVQIRKLDRPDAETVPIIAMTANAFDEDVQRSMQSGMNAHLSKPVDIDLLYETLETLIDEYQFTHQ